MTAISKRKTKLTAETSATFRGRELIVELTPYTCRIRQIYTIGAANAAKLKAAERKAARAGRKVSA